MAKDKHEPFSPGFGPIWPPGGGSDFDGIVSATAAINTIMNQIIDAATLSNMPSGFIEGDGEGD